MARSSNTQKLTDLEALNCQVDQLEKELEALKTKAEESLEVNDFETRVKNLEDFAQEFKQVSLGKDSEKSSPQKFRASFRGFQRKLRGSFKDFVKTQMDPDQWPTDPSGPGLEDPSISRWIGLDLTLKYFVSPK